MTLADGGRLTAWRPEWGDPTLSGYVLTAAYAGAVVLGLVLLASRRLPAKLRRFWWFTTGLYLLIGINKQLDLQTLLTMVGRRFVLYEGWDEQRHLLGAVFVAVLALLAAVSLPAWWRSLRTAEAPERHALGSVALLVLFVLLRAATFRGVAPVPEAAWNVLHLHRILELACVVLMIVAMKERLSRRS